MGNPYEILGLREGASQEDIKRAYKEMVKKYHPDRYQNNPLSDLAEEKMREINEAYDYLTKTGGSSGYGYDGASYGTGNKGSTAIFQEIRRDIDAGRLNKAQVSLNSIDIKTAEWVFLNGMICYKKGWYDEAMSNIEQATSMEPNNTEYRRALNTLRNQTRMYQNSAMGRGYGTSNDLLCQACQCYICADCCCDCI